MLTPDQIKSKEFHTTGKSSYKAEEVDEFLEEIHASYDQMFRENGNIIKKISILANKVEEYKKDEDSLRQALLSAQKLADRIVAEAKENSAKELSEAKEKAEKAVAEANAQAKKILDDARTAADAKVHDANKQADEIIGGINRKVTQENLVLEMLKKEVSAFRNKMMDMYKEHLTLLDRLPSYTEEKEEPVEEKEPEEEPHQTAAPEQEAVETEEPVVEEPVEEAVEEAVEEPVEKPEEEPVEEAEEDDGFELSDIESILDEADVSEEDEDAFTLDETVFNDEPEDEFEDVSSDVSEDNGGFSLNIDELDFDDDDDGITAESGDYASVDEENEEESDDDDDDDGAVSFKKFFKKK